MASSSAETLAAIARVLQDRELSAEGKNEQIAQLLSITPPSQTPSQVNGITVDLTPQQKYDMITNNLQEIINPEIIQNILNNESRPLRIYWGTATTGRPHCAYFVAMLQVAAFLRAGCHVKILLADIHGFLDNLKAPITLVKYRAKYYKFVIIELLKAVGVSIDRLEFVLGSSYQLSEKYQMDLLRLCTMVTLHDARKAGAEVVKQVENATLSGLIYPLMQALDEEYLGVDVQFGGVDQRKIFTLAKEILPKVNYSERAHLMNPMIPGLAAGGKMSASEPNSKIDVLDKPDVVRKKISKAYCEPKIIKDNGVLSFVQYVLLPASALKQGAPKFTVNRHDAEPLVYTTIGEMYRDYESELLTPQLLKAATSTALTELLAPLQAAYDSSPEWQKTLQEAYPPEEKAKFKKAPKNKGTMYPGASGSSTPRAQTQPDGSVEGQDKEEVDLASSATEAIQNLGTKDASDGPKKA